MPVADWMNTIGTMLNNMRVMSGGEVRKSNRHIRFYLDESNAFPYGDLWSFGVTISGDKVTIHNIACQIGDATEKTLSDTTVTITADGEYVYFKCPFDSSAMSVGVTSSVADFDIAGDYYADFVLQCSFDGTSAGLTQWGCAGHRQKHPGNFGQL